MICECGKKFAQKSNHKRHVKGCKLRIILNLKAAIASKDAEILDLKKSKETIASKDAEIKLKDAEIKLKDAEIKLLKQCLGLKQQAPSRPAPVKPKRVRISDDEYKTHCTPITFNAFVAGMDITDEDIKSFIFVLPGGSGAKAQIMGAAHGARCFKEILVRNIKRISRTNRPLIVIDKARGMFELYTDTGWKKFSSADDSLADLGREYLNMVNNTERTRGIVKICGPEFMSFTYSSTTLISAQKIFGWMIDTIPTLKQDKDSLSQLKKGERN